MRIARVIGNLVTTEKHPAYEKRKLLMVQPVDLEGRAAGNATMAIDYVGAGAGDWVLIGAAPGLASLVFKIEIAPINDLVMGVVDRVALEGAGPDFGNSVGSGEGAAEREQAKLH